MNSKRIISSLTKYLSQALLLYFVIKLIPKSELQNIDACGIILVAVMTHMTMNILHKTFEKNNKHNSVQSCDCKINETFKEQTLNNDSDSSGDSGDSSGDGDCDNENYGEEEQKNEFYDYDNDGIDDRDNARNRAGNQNNLIWGKNYDNDMAYNELPADMMKPLGEIDTSYTFMPPWKWWPPKARPPVCVSDKKCEPCPVTTIGAPTDVKDWDSSRRVTPGLGINIPYIQKLNEVYN